MNVRKIIGSGLDYIVDVGGIPLIKESILYTLAADRFHTLIIAPPAVGSKTRFRFFIESVTSPNFRYIGSGAWTTKVGIAEALKSIGTGGVAFFDEIQNSTGDELSILYDVLQFQKIKVTKHNVDKEYDTPCNVFATANPVKNHNRWIRYGDIENMRDQIKIPDVILRRFHAILCLDDYNTKDFDKVNRKKTLQVDLDEEDIAKTRKFIEDARELQPKLIIPEFIYSILLGFKKFEKYMLLPVTNELIEGFVHLAIARARLDKSKKVTEKHWEEVGRYYTRVLESTGLTKDVIRSVMGSK